MLLGLGGTERHARQDQAVVRAIIGMAHALELEVVAEGVETAAQRETLRHLGCDSHAGIFVQPAGDPGALESLLPPVPRRFSEKHRGSWKTGGARRLRS